MSKADSDGKGFNWNWVALGVLLIAYIFSAGRFLLFSMKNKEGEDSKVIRIAHWQLEPGYREALDWAMNEYSQQPHVKEAGIEIIQMPLPTRVYAQFMNVHLISGTAPDIAAAGITNLIQGNAIARFYASLGNYVNEPNPYNSLEYTSPDLDPELRAYLAEAAWRDTFLDGMEGGWKGDLNDYYSVPISNIGGMRMFYNLSLVKQGKAFIRKAIAQDPEPKWLENCWLRTEDGQERGYLPDNERLRNWLANDDVPDTLGQLILLCYGLQEMAKAENLNYLTPISVGNYTAGDPIYRYQSAFTRHFADVIEQNGVPNIQGIEAADGLARGAWSLYDRPMTEFMDFAKTISQFYPAGYLGLDREQAQRRFVSGDAAMFTSGSWDAAGVFKGSQSSVDPSKRFDVKITQTPMPASDERWGDLLDYTASEANFKAGVPLSINKQSHNFDWALDFLQFISSQPINEEFNKRAAWLPATVGAETVDSMVDFEPVIEGFSGEDAFNPTGLRSTIRTQWTGKFKSAVSGEIEYDEFVEIIMEYLKRPHQGVPGYWHHDLKNAKDQTRALDRNLSVEEYFQALSHEPQAEARFRSLFYKSLTDDEGVNVELMWRRLHPGEPFPTID